MLELINIEKSFSNGAGDKLAALKNLNLQIEPGSFTILVGANGSGKSTLLNLIAGTIYPDNGRILLNGKHIEGLPDYSRAKYISRIFQNPVSGTAPDLSIIENFRLAFLRRKKRTLTNGINAEFRKLVGDNVSKLGLGLENKLNQPVGQLSGGQRQALALLMAIIAPPEILLLDEPTAALDPKAAGHILKLASEFIKEKKLTTLFVTHNMYDAIKYGDRLIQLHTGEIKRDLKKEDKDKLEVLSLIQWFGEEV